MTYNPSSMKVCHQSYPGPIWCVFLVCAAVICCHYICTGQLSLSNRTACRTGLECSKERLCHVTTTITIALPLSGGREIPLFVIFKNNTIHCKTHLCVAHEAILVTFYVFGLKWFRFFSRIRSLRTRTAHKIDWNMSRNFILLILRDKALVYPRKRLPDPSPQI